MDTIIAAIFGLPATFLPEAQEAGARPQAPKARKPKRSKAGLRG